MKKAFSKMSKSKYNVEKQVKVGCFFTDTTHSNLKTTKKTVEPMSLKKVTGGSPTGGQ